jgi:hypothetical protein
MRIKQILRRNEKMKTNKPTIKQIYGNEKLEKSGYISETILHKVSSITMTKELNTYECNGQKYYVINLIIKHKNNSISVIQCFTEDF